MDALTGLWLMLFGQTVQTASTVTTEYENVKQAVIREFKEDAPTALAICFAEAGCRPNAVSSTEDYGTFQINLKAHWAKIPVEGKEAKIAWLKNFQNNVKLAKRIKDSSGWYPWVTYQTGVYKQYLSKI